MTPEEKWTNLVSHIRAAKPLLGAKLEYSALTSLSEEKISICFKKEQEFFYNQLTEKEALAQLTTPRAKKLLTGLGILSKEELESRYHVRLERYSKDMLIECHTLDQLIGTQVLPAALGYLGTLTRSATEAQALGIKGNPALVEAQRVGALVATLQATHGRLKGVTAKADGLHDAAEAQAQLLTGAAAEAMAAVREASDALELVIGDTVWPLPRYREMLFPV